MTIGLIAEGGGMRGAYTAGVLEAFLDHELYFSYAIGVSAGANTLCSYLSRQKLRNKRLYTHWITDKRFISWKNLLKEGAYFGMNFLFHDLPMTLDPFDFETFQKTPCHFKVGVTNCLTGKCDYFEPTQAADLPTADLILQASSSLPFISKKVIINGTPYLDGGIADPIPIMKAMADGCEKNVIILTRNAGYHKTYSKKVHLFAKRHFKKYPHLIEAIDKRYQVYDQTLKLIDTLEQEKKVFVLRPIKPLQLDRFEKDSQKLAALYEQGYEEATGQLAKLQRFMAQ